MYSSTPGLHRAPVSEIDQNMRAPSFRDINTAFTNVQGTLVARNDPAHQRAVHPGTSLCCSSEMGTVGSTNFDGGGIGGFLHGWEGGTGAVVAAGGVVEIEAWEGGSAVSLTLEVG